MGLLKSLGLRPETPGDDPMAALFLTPDAADKAAKTYIRRKRLPLETPYKLQPSRSRTGTYRGWRAVVHPQGEHPYALTTYQTV